VHDNFFDLSSIEGQLTDYNGCIFNFGVSSVGLKEEQYHRLSGTGTDSTERGKSMWARVKGKTENHLLQLPFKKAYMFRPGYIHPTRGLKNTHKFYAAISWLYPVMKLLFPKYVSSLADVGIAMIKTVTIGYEKSILEIGDINRLAKS
jgi:hypothetical protein